MDFETVSSSAVGRCKPLSKEFGKVVRSAKVKRGSKRETIYRKGLGFYGLRHTFQTIGDAARDPIATRAIMGHAEAGNDMSAVYREGVDDSRLKAVTDHVHQWLFATDEAKAKPEPAKEKAAESPVAECRNGRHVGLSRPSINQEWTLERAALADDRLVLPQIILQLGHLLPDNRFLIDDVGHLVVLLSLAAVGFSRGFHELFVAAADEDGGEEHCRDQVQAGMVCCGGFQDFASIVP